MSGWIETHWYLVLLPYCDWWYRNVHSLQVKSALNLGRIVLTSSRSGAAALLASMLVLAVSGCVWMCMGKFFKPKYLCAILSLLFACWCMLLMCVGKGILHVWVYMCVCFIYLLIYLFCTGFSKNIQIFFKWQIGLIIFSPGFYVTIKIPLQFTLNEVLFSACPK